MRTYRCKKVTSSWLLGTKPAHLEILLGDPNRTEENLPSFIQDDGLIKDVKDGLRCLIDPAIVTRSDLVNSSAVAASRPRVLLSQQAIGLPVRIISAMLTRLRSPPETPPMYSLPTFQRFSPAARPKFPPPVRHSSKRRMPRLTPLHPLKHQNKSSSHPSTPSQFSPQATPHLFHNLQTSQAYPPKPSS